MVTFVPGGMGGSETYARALTHELVGRSDIDVTVVIPRGAVGLFAGAREVVVPGLLVGDSTTARLSTVARAAAPWFGRRRALTGAAVVHYPFTVPVPLRPRGIPLVMTLHDVQHHDLPEQFSPAERVYRSATYDRPARRADVVLTISEFCRQRIVEHLHVDPARIVVAPLGVDAAAFTAYDGPREPFVLYPAAGWPHKNHARLLAAMTLLREQGNDLRLVLTGGRAPDLGPLPDWVEHRGRVSEGELRGLYRSASCLAFPSLYEGFGLPALEAMASGCPVAAATSGALPEVCGDAAIMFDPRDVSAMAAAITDAIASRDRLAPLGLARAAEFPWRACADVHADAYRRLAIR
jgi:glycosyltransferase involved in cell wall biosynthesis